MSSKKFVYLLMMVAIVCSFITSDTAYGQSKTANLLFKGTVQNADGTLAPGHSVAGDITGASVLPLSPVRSGPDGTYQYSFISLSNDITAGDVVEFTVTDSAGNVVGGATYTVRAADLPAPSIVDLDIILGAGIAIEANPSAIPADGTSISTILVTLQDGGEPVTGDTVTATISPAGKGSVSAFTEAGNGVYSATYTAPSLALTASDAAQITVASTQLGKTADVTITLLIVPTDVTVTVTPSVFSADTPANGVITVTVDRAGPVADETVTFSLSPAVGMVSAVTNNGDGTYSADYTSGGTVGNVTLTATATQAGASGRATITIDAGPPAAIELSAAPETVSSLGSATVTAMVSDSAGNGVGGLSPTGTALSGTITSFAEDTANLGMYTVTYTAPLVDAEGTDTITFMVDGISEELTLKLTPVPPVDVSILVIEGTVFKVDGVTPADGVTTTVTVGSNDPQVYTTDMDGGYSVTDLILGGVVASTGDAVSIVVTDDTGAERGREDFRLTNDQLGEGGTATVMQDVVTDIIVPPRSVNVLVVEGVIISDDGVSPVEDVDFTVTVTVGSNTPQTAILEEEGAYSVTAVNLIGSIASTGDAVSIVVTDDTGAERGTAELELTNVELGEDGSGIAKLDVMTDIIVPPRSVNVLVVEGVIISDDGVSPVEDVDFTVTVTVGSNTPQTAILEEEGAYSVTAVNLIGSVASTGDMVSTVVVTDADGEVRGTAELELTNVELGEDGSGIAKLDVMTDITLPPKSVNILVVEGVAYKDDETTSVGPGLDVTITVGANTPQTTQPAADGSFATTTVNLLGPAATSGDPVSIVVADSSGERGREEFTLSRVQLGDADSATVTQNVITNIGATSGVLVVTGTVYLKNGDTMSVPAESHLREGDLTVVVTNTTRNMMESGPVDDDGGYDVTFLNLLGVVAETGDILTVEVQNEAGETMLESPVTHTLTTPEVKAANAKIDIHTTVPAEVRALNITGSVVELDGSAAGAGLEVTLSLGMNGHTMPPGQTLTDAAGGYEYTFVDLITPVAATGDILTVDVLREADQFRGHKPPVELRSHELVDGQLTVDPITLIPPTLELGGLSINPNDAVDGIISLEAINTNPALLEMIPSGILHLDLLQGLLSSLPPGFESVDGGNIQNENFGNAITPRPAWHVLAENSQPDPYRWVNGNQLNLYVLTGPTAQGVTFTLSGPQPEMVQAVPVPAGGTVPYTFQLEEERAVLFLPSWPGLNADMSVFESVTLMVDDYAPMPMARNMDGVWEAEADLNLDSKVAYYYQVKLAQSYQVRGETVSDWAMPDPRNLQVEDRGIVETLLAPEFGPDLVAIVTTMDLKLRSVFTVPAVTDLQALWVGRLQFAAGADGMYQLDTAVQYGSRYMEEITGKMFMVDRTAPTADLMVGIGENAGMYQRGDGSYVTAAHTDEGTLNLATMSMAAPSESEAYLYQIIQLDDEGNPGNQVWNPIVVAGEMPPLTYMEPHQIQMPIGDVGQYGIRAVGVDSILNISSNTMPTLLDIVPPDHDTAAVTLVHADYNDDGTTDGPFEMEQSADGATIFSDRSNVNLTVEMTKQTGHPLKSIAIDFWINGAGDWKPIAMLTGDDLADAESGLEVNWNRMDDFADLLDIRGQAMVRVTVINALDVPGESTVTVELVPPALQLGGLSINTGYEAGLNALQGLRELDVAALVTNLLGMDPSSLISPSPLPLALALLGTLDYIQSALPAGFETADEQIHRENFGNAITPKPIWYPIASADQRDAGRWINGNQLHLYTFAGPTAESLTFSITGAQTAMAAASKVETGGSFMYNFQLEEELIAIFAGSMPAFAAVTLMIDGQPPIDMAGNAGVWSAEAPLTPGSKVSYYYRIELAQPYQDMFINKPIQVFPIPDPRNLQIEESYAIQAIVALLNGGIDALSTLDPGLRSVFTVPAVDDDSQSLWVGKLDFPADDMYQLDVAVEYSSGSTDKLTGKMFTVDRTAPAADTMVHLDTPGENIGMYLRDGDGTYVATALPNPGKAILNVSATPIDDSDLETYLYQLARLDAAGNPGTWNPILTTVDLQVSDLMNVLPLTSRSPHHVQMLVRSETGNDLAYGTYGLRVVGIDNILNADSSRGPGVVLDLVPPDPDIAEVSSVAADFDGNGVIEGPEIQSTAGDVVVFSDSMVKLTVHMRQRTEHPLTSVVIEFQLPGGDWQTIGMFGADQLVGVMQGHEFPVTLPVPDFPSLPDRGAHVMVRTVTTNALTLEHEEVFSAAYQRRLPPEVSAIHTYVTDRHPDSDAAQGTITVSAFTQAMTLPDAAAVQLEIRRSADADWMPLGIVQLAGTTVISINEEVDIIADRINSIISGAPDASIDPIYRKWSYSFDSAVVLEDTIMDDSPAASDASLDDNPYVLQAIAVDAAGTGYPSADGVTDSFSLDNYSPTAITQVANEVEMVAAREDDSYYVSGLIAEGVPDPMLTLTSRTGAHPNAFMGGIALAVNDASGTAVEIAETAFTGSGDHTYTAAFNLGSIPNGMYTFMAVGHTASGAPEERIVAMAITVEVGNFTPPDNFADPTVDILSVTNTRGEANSPSDTDAMYPIGLPAVGDEACATLIVPNVSAGDVDVLIGDDLMSAAMMGALTVMDPDANSSISICLDTSGLDEGMYSFVGVVSKANGSVQFGLPSIRVDRTAPVIEIVSPLEGHQVSTLPTVQVAYTDATGFDPEKTNPMPVEITLTRLASDKTVDTNTSMIRMIAAAGEVLTQTGNIVYTHDDQLAGGAYRIDATVTDALGNTSTAEPVEFTSEGVQPSVAIITPSAGQVVDPDQAFIISAAFTGIGEITVDQLLINGGTYKPQSVKGNLLTHTIQPPFGVLFKRGSGNRISIKIVDEEGNTAEATTNFAVAKDTIPPVVATYSPLGIIRTDRPIAAATVTDASGINTRSLTIIIAGVPGNQGTGRRSSPTSTTVTFTPSIAVTPGPYTARVTVEDVHGNRTEAEWQFTVELDVTPPAITTNSPQGVIRTDKPIISVSASDDMSGVDTIEIGVKGEGNQTVEGVTSVRSDKTSATFTPAASLTSGTYTVDVKLADVAGNKASGQWQFTVELDTIPPAITITRPMQEHTENRRPIISASYTDNLSGVDAESITLSLDGAAIEPDAVSETQVMFTPTFDLTFGQHTVKLEVSDMAPSANTAVQEWSFFVERMGIANARNYPNPFDGDTTIALRISRQASITVQIYDFTGRLVAEPISNSVREAGPVEIPWDGQTSAGDNLARGVYFCHILMESELEPQSAILKMAIISD